MVVENMGIDFVTEVKDNENYEVDLDIILYLKDMVDVYTDEKEKDLQINEKKNIYQVDELRINNVILEIIYEEVKKDTVKRLDSVSNNNVRMGIIEVN